ncbi:MAG: hypothetical protein QOG50_197, partial [Actinomycetota bacterium]|nr:hypothetical protein [Actinomycetota bacterium]
VGHLDHTLDARQGKVMCFAPEADAVVGGIVIAVGVDALRHVGSPKQIALAALPLLFGLHQVTEAFVWWGLRGQVSESIERLAVWIWLLFAFVTLPVLLPIAVDLVESSKVRRRVIQAFAGIGLVVAVALAVAIFRGPVNARIQGHCISYTVDALGNGREWTVLYVIAACGALLASSHRELAALGALNVVVTPLLMWLTISGFVSLWCFWAAIASVVIALHLRRVARTRDAGRDDRIRDVPAVARSS